MFNGVASKYFSKYFPNQHHNEDDEPLPPSSNISQSNSASSSWAEKSRPRNVIIIHVEELGNVLAKSTRVERDLGFQGRLGKNILLTYGDTMYRDENWSDRFIGMTCNSIAIATSDPTRVKDPLLNETDHPKCFLEPSAEYGEDCSDYALGITNIVQVEEDRGASSPDLDVSDIAGILFSLLNYRPGGIQHFQGAGVAEVRLSHHRHSVVPVARRLSKKWWNEDEPRYGDICALRFDGYIYAYGHGPDNDWIYVARAPITQAFDLAAYEYWDGACWQPDRLYKSSIGEKESVFWKIQQGQIT